MKQKPFVQLIPDQRCECSAVSSQDETQFLLIFTGFHFSIPLDLSLTALSRDNISFHLCFFIFYGALLMAGWLSSVK